MEWILSLWSVRRLFGDPMVATGEGEDFMAVRILEAVVVDFHLPHRLRRSVHPESEETIRHTCSDTDEERLNQDERSDPT